jgi:hypothetical protein
MVEPFSLAAAAVTLLAPYLERLAGRVAEQATDTIADAALPTVKRLYQTVKAKLRPGSYAGNQLQGLEERPESEGRRQAMRTALAEELESDPTFAAELERLISEAQAAGGIRITATDVGVVSGKDAHLRGNYVAGRDMTVGGIPPKDQSIPPEER